MKIYISGPITGTDRYMERFDGMERLLTNAGHEVINPARVNAALPKSTTYEQYMQMSLTMLSMCDTVVFLDGWENSKGAKIEYDYAMKNRYTLVFDLR